MDSNDAIGSHCEGLEKKPITIDHSSNEYELHFSVSSLTSKQRDTINDTIGKKELDMNLNNIESISLQFDTQSSGLQEERSLEWRNDFSLTSLHSSDFLDGCDSIIVTRQRTSRKQWTNKVGTCQDSSSHETSQS
jgi:hypothetical protein